MDETLTSLLIKHLDTPFGKSDVLLMVLDSIKDEAQTGDPDPNTPNWQTAYSEVLSAMYATKAAEQTADEVREPTISGVDGYPDAESIGKPVS